VATVANCTDRRRKRHGSPSFATATSVSPSIAFTEFLVLRTCPTLRMYMQARKAQLLPNDSKRSCSDNFVPFEALLHEPTVSLTQWAQPLITAPLNTALPAFAGPRLFRTVLRFRGHLEGGVTPSAVPAKPQNGAALRDHPTKDRSSSVSQRPRASHWANARGSGQCCQRWANYCHCARILGRALHCSSHALSAG
jgi:hypothetical protein